MLPYKKMKILQKIENLNQEELIAALNKNGYSDFDDVIREHEINGIRFLALTDFQIALWRSRVGYGNCQRIWSFLEHIKQHPEEFVLDNDQVDNKVYHIFPQSEKKPIEDNLPVYTNTTEELSKQKNNVILKPQKEELPIYANDAKQPSLKHKRNDIKNCLREKLPVDVKNDPKQRRHEIKTLVEENLPVNSNVVTDEQPVYINDKLIPAVKITNKDENKSNICRDECPYDEEGYLEPQMKEKNATFMDKRPLPSVPQMKKPILQIVKPSENLHEPEEQCAVYEDAKEICAVSTSTPTRKFWPFFQGKKNKSPVIPQGTLEGQNKDKGKKVSFRKQSVTLPTPPPLNISAADLKCFEELDKKDSQKYTLNDLKKESFFKESIKNRQVAENRLKKAEDGSFIVRQSSKFFCTFTIKYKANIYHIGIKQDPDGTLKCLADDADISVPFSNVKEIIKYYKAQPLVLKNKDNPGKLERIYLKKAIN